MTNEEAREYFKSKNLSYSDIMEGDLLTLIILINRYLKIHRKEHKDMKLTLSRITHLKLSNDRSMKEFYLYANGSYFNKREAISFNDNGWIGFAGWASSCNTEPFINAFKKWCDILSFEV